MSKPKKRKRHNSTQIIEKLRQADAMLAAEQAMGQATNISVKKWCGPGFRMFLVRISVGCGQGKADDSAVALENDGVVVDLKQLVAVDLLA